MELKDKVLQLKDIKANLEIGTFDSTPVFAYNINDEGVNYTGFKRQAGDKYHCWFSEKYTWSKLELPENKAFKDFLEECYENLCPKISVTKEGGVIKFFNPDTGESLHCDLNQQTFTKVSAKGRQKRVTHPHSFFSGVLGHLLILKIPADISFATLIKNVIKVETRCRNFGTFLIRMFDKIHLESYISVGVPYDYSISIGYSWFDKDIRKVLDKHNISYSTDVQQFFVTNYDRAKIFFNQFKDEERFVELFKLFREQSRHINILIDQYGYEPKALYKYAKDRDFSARGYRIKDYENNLPQHLFNIFQELSDYIRMAATIEFHNDNGNEVVLDEAIEEGENPERVVLKMFEKYPKNLHLAHSTVTAQSASLKKNYNEAAFKAMQKQEWEYLSKDFSIILPKSTAEIKLEGVHLGHCVGSYVERIIRGETSVVFLRKTEEIDTPYYTIEIRNNKVAQIQGKSGKRPEYEEKLFLSKFTKAKGIEYRS